MYLVFLFCKCLLQDVSSNTLKYSPFTYIDILLKTMFLARWNRPHWILGRWISELGLVIIRETGWDWRANMRHIGKPPVCAICQVILLQISGDTIACSTVCLNWPASVVLTLALSRLEKVWSTAHDHTWPGHPVRVVNTQLGMVILHLFPNPLWNSLNILYGGQFGYPNS